MDNVMPKLILKLLIGIYFFVGTIYADIVFPGAAWETASPSSQNIDKALLEEAMTYLKDVVCNNQGTSQTVVICNGYMIWKGNNIDSKHEVWSCTKSFSSTCLGLLIDDGKCSLDTRIKTVVPQSSPNYQKFQDKCPDLTFRHITTLTSGYKATDNNAPFVPTDRKFEHGKILDYNDHSMNLFSYLNSHVAGESQYVLFKRRIADPIGMKNWSWGTFGKVDGIIVTGGSGTLGKAVQITAREMARFGWLLANFGKWDGTQLLGEAWVKEALVSHADTVALSPFGTSNLNNGLVGAYGYNFWTNGMRYGGELRWPDATHYTAALQGYNNNYCVVIPEWKMVVVRLGTDGKKDHDLWKGFFTRLKKAVGTTEIVLPDNTEKYSSMDFKIVRGNSGIPMLQFKNINKNTDIKMFNLSGRLIKKMTLKKGSNEILLKGINCGIYMIHFQADGVSITRKLMLK